MKTKLFIMVLLLMVSSNAFSQPNDDNTKYSGMCGDRAGYMADYMYKNLDLSDDQYTKVYSTMLSHEMQRDEDFENYSDDKDAFRDASEKRRTSLDSSMKGILTSDQYDKYKQMEDNMMNNMNKKYGKGRNGMHRMN